jgi:hypothetical protein
MKAGGRHLGIPRGRRFRKHMIYLGKFHHGLTSIVTNLGIFTFAKTLKGHLGYRSNDFFSLCCINEILYKDTDNDRMRCVYYTSISPNVFEDPRLVSYRYTGW